MEEICHLNPNDSVCDDHGTPVPIVVHRLQLSQEFHGLDRPPRLAVPLPFLRLLQNQLWCQKSKQAIAKRGSLHACSGRRDRRERQPR